MVERVQITEVQGKTIDTMVRRVSKYGDKYTNLVVIYFTDGSSIEMVPMRCADSSREGEDMIRIEQYDK